MCVLRTNHIIKNCVRFTFSNFMYSSMINRQGALVLVTLLNDTDSCKEVTNKTQKTQEAPLAKVTSQPPDFKKDNTFSGFKQNNYVNLLNFFVAGLKFLHRYIVSI